MSAIDEIATRIITMDTLERKQLIEKLQIKYYFNENEIIRELTGWTKGKVYQGVVIALFAFNSHRDGRIDNSLLTLDQICDEYLRRVRTHRKLYKIAIKNIKKIDKSKVRTIMGWNTDQQNRAYRNYRKPYETLNWDFKNAQIRNWVKIKNKML